MRILSFEFSTKNCENDDDIMLQYVQECVNLEYNNQHEEYESLSDSNLPYLFEEENLKKSIKKTKTKSSYDGVRRYVLGFGLLKKVKCSDCLEVMKHKDSHHRKGKCSNNNELFIMEKNIVRSKDQNILCNPSDYFLSIFNTQFNTFSEYFDANKHIKGLKSSLLKQCIKVTNNVFPEWFDINNSCYDHRVEILDYLLRIFIKRNAKWVVKNIKKPKKYLSRLRRLQE